MVENNLCWDASRALKRGRLVNLSAIVERQILGGSRTGPKLVLVLCRTRGPLVGPQPQRSIHGLLRRIVAKLP